MKYLVTGADGFLGRHFLATLAERNIATRAMIEHGSAGSGLPGKAEIVRADLLKGETLGPAVDGITHIIHLAARVHVMKEQADDAERAYFEVNVEGTGRLIEAAADAGVSRALLMSTVKAMGEEEAGIFDEACEPHPTTPYGRSKLQAEDTMFDIAHRRGLHAVAIRLPMVYGPGAKGNVLRLLDAAAANRRLPFGAVRNRRSIVYVGNVVDASLAAIESDASAGQVYFVCDARPYSTAEIYSAICRAMGKEPLLRNVPPAILALAGWAGSAAEFVFRRPMPVNREIIQRVTGDLYFSPKKIESQLGFIPKVDLAEGIRRTVQWYQQGCPPNPSAE